MAVKDAPAAREERGYVCISNFVRVEGRQLLQGFRAEWSDRLLSVQHFHRVMEAKVAGKAGGSLCICSKLSELRVRFIWRSGVEVFGALIARNVAIDDSIRGREVMEGM